MKRRGRQMRLAGTPLYDPEEGAAKNRIGEILSKMPSKSARRVIKAVARAKGVLNDIPDETRVVTPMMSSAVETLKTANDPEAILKKIEEFEVSTDVLHMMERNFQRWVREWGFDPKFKSPTDVELFAMLYTDLHQHIDDGEEIIHKSPAFGVATGMAERLAETRTGAAYLLKRTNQEQFANFYPWTKLWKAGSYARMACGHKLAAALMMTTAPEDADIQAPWEAWSLYVPNGMLPIEISKDVLQKLAAESGRLLKEGADPSSMIDVDVKDPVPGEKALHGEICRIWCRGAEPYAAVHRWEAGPCNAMELQVGSRAPTNVCIRNYVRGVCLLMGKHDLPEKKRYWGPKSGKRRTGKEPAVGVEYELGSPVTIDLRDAVNEFLAGKRKGHSTSPSVQFLVRGHWRHQAYGPLRADRKWIWIEPFWKGPEEARVLLRSHVVRDSKPEGPPPEKETKT